MVKTFSKKLIAILVLLAMLIVSAIISVSYAWFYVGSNEVSHNIGSGSFIYERFHCGDGSEGDPFVITRPIHYYHMVELYQRTPEDFALGNIEKTENKLYKEYYFLLIPKNYKI